MRAPISVQEIVQELNWPRSSAFNIVATLVDEGYLYQPTPRGGYSPTTRWMELAKKLTESQPLPNTIHNKLVELMEKTGETLFLATAEGSNLVFLDVIEPSADIRFAANVGQRLPIHITAAGRAILSQYTATERKAVLGRINYQPYEKQKFLNAASVEEDIVNSAKQGWYINMGLYAPGVAGIAVPFPYQNRRLAISLGGPVNRVEAHAHKYGKLLLHATRELLRI